MLRKFIFSLVAVLMVTSAFGQSELVKYNYKTAKFVKTGAERVQVASSTPLELKLGRITFSDGVSIYTLRVDFISSTAWKMPKNATMIVELANGHNLMLKNYKDEANLVAPKGVNRNGKTVYYNYGEYYLEQGDLDKMLKGVTGIDATRRMTSDGHEKVSFKKNEFSAALSQAYDAICSAKKPVALVDGSQLDGMNDYSGNRLVHTVKEKITPSVSISLTYLYSAESNTESYDLEIQIADVTVPGGSGVSFTTPIGNVIRLRQEKDLPKGQIVCYPELDQLKDMMHGIGRISYETAAGEQFQVVPANEFAAALNKLYNAVQTVAIL